MNMCNEVMVNINEICIKVRVVGFCSKSNGKIATRYPERNEIYLALC